MANDNANPPAVRDMGVSPVTIVLLNYCNWQRTAACLQSLAAQDYPAAVMVVDNNSPDDSVARLRDAFPTLDLTVAPTNGGFASGNNIALRRVLAGPSKYAWVLNNDTVVAPDALRLMVAAAEADPTAGAVGCRLVDMEDPSRTLAWGGGMVCTVLGYCRHVHRPCRQQLSYLTAASVLLRTDALRAVGLFDDGFFMYWEDTDLSFRLRAGGWRLAVAGDAVVRHAEGSSFGRDHARRDAMISRSMVRFFRKHARVPIVPIMAGTMLRSLWRIAHLQLGRALAVWRSCFSISDLKSQI